MADKEKEKEESLKQEGEQNLLGEVDEAVALKQEIEKLKKERDDYLDGWRRAKAELANYKKDELKRLEEVAKFSQEDLVQDLLTVLDAFDLALAALEKSGPVEKGVYLIKSQLEELLRQRGLNRIQVKVGDKFDPALHEAIGLASGGSEAGRVAEEISAGYTLHGKVIRPSRVKVFK